MKVLFVCNQGKHRSRTAKELFKDEFETKAKGLFCENPISEKDLLWADIICVMEDHQRSEIAKKFPKIYIKKRILSIGIPDIYSYNQKELVELLKLKMDSTIHQIVP